MVTLGQNNKKGVKLGLQSQVEWLPQRYTESSRRRLQLVLIFLAGAAAWNPACKVMRWCTSPPVTTLADALHLGVMNFLCELANWLYVGFGFIRSVVRSSGSGLEALKEADVNVTVDGVLLLGSGEACGEDKAEKKRQ